MLGGLLSRQAEEEERQLREAEHAAAAVVVSQDSGADLAGGSSSTLSKNNQYGSLDSTTSADNNNQVVVEEEERSERYVDRYDENDHSELEGEYSYGEEEADSDNELFDDGESSDDSDGSSADFHSSRRRRKQKRNQPTSSSSSNWRRSLRKSTRRIGSKIRAAVVAIADVDNVWDSPDANYRSLADRTMGAYAEDPDINGDNNANTQVTRSSIIYNANLGGHSLRHLLVDRVVPFRLFSAELILGAHALLTGVGMLMGNYFWRKEKKDFEMSDRRGGGWLGLPLADVGLMAVLDTVYLLLGVISGAHVPPVLTVILVQTTIPLTACFTQCVHPDGRCAGGASSTQNDTSSPGGNSSGAHSHSNVQIISNSTLNEMDMSFPDISTIPHLPAQAPPPVKGWGGLSRYHIFGTVLMFLAIFLGLTPAVLSLDHIIITKSDAMPERTAYNTIVFCLAAIPAAMSQLYKEHTMTRLRQPIDRNMLNFVLSIFQLLFAIVVSPLAYGLQGMGDGPGWTSLYQSKSIGENFSHGLQCFIGTLDEETMENGYHESARCNWAWALVLLHVISIMMVGVAIDKLAAATKVMYRGVSMGIIVAVILMFVYQIRDKWCEYGPLVSFFHLTSTAVLIVGAEIYHRVSLVDASFETVYPEIGDLYEEEE
ncbi:hypothetical protein ACHAXR_006676 [Thalassiosira sp. AJA248-18]